MSDLAFSQPERRSFLVPALIALVLLGGIFAFILARTPHRIADISIPHTTLLPTHTVFGNDSKLVGSKAQAVDALYVVATVHIDNQLNLPLYIKDITATLSTPDGDASASAIQKSDLPNLYVTFPALQPLAANPLFRETEIAPRQSAEGTVILQFPTTQAIWDQRTAATLTVDFYHQGPLTIPIPKP